MTGLSQANLKKSQRQFRRRRQHSEWQGKPTNNCVQQTNKCRPPLVFFHYSILPLPQLEPTVGTPQSQLQTQTSRSMLKLLLLLCALIGSCVASLRLNHAASSRHLMVNGKDTKQGQYLFHTQVGCCSGALIAPDVVLAAAHEIPPLDVRIGMQVTVGAYYSDPVKNADVGDHRTVTQVFMHPGYTGIHNDFAVLILDSPSDIEPIHINRKSKVPVAHSNVTLLGTGTFNLTTSERSVVLQKAHVMYLPNDECSTSYDPTRGISYAGEFLDETNLCTTGKSDGCVYDSGAPVIVEKEDGDNVLIALISFGVDCADPFYPAVNARVSAVHEWIDDLVCQNSIDPPKDFHCGNKSKNSTTVPNSTMFPSTAAPSTTVPSMPPSVAFVVSSDKSTETFVSRGTLVSFLVFLCAGTIAALFVVWRNKKATGTKGESKSLLSKTNGDGSA